MTGTPVTPHMLAREGLNEFQTGILFFVEKMSADYRNHSGVAVREDILAAIVHFKIPALAFYDDDFEAEVATAEAEVYRLTGKVPS